jgi:hypothetical protein
VLADSARLKWSGLFARRCRFPRVVDGFLVPATAEPSMAGVACVKFCKKRSGSWKGGIFYSGSVSISFLCVGAFSGPSNKPAPRVS